MNLSYEEAEELIESITTGKKIVDISDKVVVFKHPSVEIKMKARRIYKSEYSNAIKEGMVTHAQMKELIEKRNLVTESDRKKIKDIKSKLDAQRILLAKTTRVKARQDRIKGVIEELEKQKSELESKERSKYSMTAETRAEETRILYMCWACTYNENEELYWPTQENFTNEKNFAFRQDVLSEFIKFYGGIPTTTVRALARSNIWRIKYVTSTKLNEELFGVPVSRYTSDMLNLVYWSHYYQNINEMMPEDQPPDDIIEDDAALDAFMEEYHKERTKDIADRKYRKGHKSKLSAFDKEEVLVTKIANELYDDIEFDEAREAAAVKDKPMVSKKSRRRR